MDINRFFIKSFGLKKEEGTKFSLLFFHSFFVGLFIAFYFVPANSMFIKNHGAAQLPYAYILSGIAGYLTSSIYSLLQKRVSSKTLYLGATAFMFVITLGARLALPYVDSKILSFFIFIWAWPFISLSGTLSGGLALQFLNLIQVKRLFGLMNMGAVIASILGYLAIPVLLKFLGHSYDLLFIGDVGLVASVVLLLMLFKTLVGSTGKEIVKQSVKEVTKFKDLVKDRYFLLIFTSATLSMITIYVVDFGFLSSVNVQKSLFTAPDSISKYLALVYGGLKVGELLISYFSSRLLSKHGVKLGLTILPISITLIVAISTIVGITAGVATFAFLALMTLNKSMERILRRGLDDPAFNILYQPLPGGQKMAVQTKVAVVMQVAISLAGGLLLLANQVLKTSDGYRLEYYPLILLPVLILWVIIARQLYLAYKGKLRQILIDISRTKKRESSRYLYGSEFLTKKFKMFNESVVEMSVSMLSETNPRAIEPYASSLLNMRNSSIKIAILSKIDATWRNRILNSIKKIYISDKSEHIRQLALKVKNVLDDAFPEKISDEDLDKLKRSEKFEDKLLIQKMMIYSRIPMDDGVILKLLDDNDKTIKTAAINLASKSKSNELLNKLIELINSDEYYHIAGEALLEAGDKVLNDLEDFFNKQTESRILLRVIEILAKIGSSRAKSILVRFINYPDRKVQLEILAALYFCKFQAGPKELPEIRAKLEAVVENIVWIYACILDIETERNTLKLLQAVDMERELNLEILFKLLSFMYEPRIINLIRKNIIGKNTIFAIEIVDNFISQDIKQLVIPIFDDISVSMKIKKLSFMAPQKRMNFVSRLNDIITKDFDKIGPWTISKAIELLGKLHSKNKTSTETGEHSHDYKDIEIWTTDKVDKTLSKIRRSEMPDEVFVCLFHPDELVYSTAARVIYEENPVKCTEYLERMSEKKKAMLDDLANNGYLLAERIKLLKKHPLFFRVPENYLAELAKFVRVVNLKENEELPVINPDGTDNVIILIKGELEGADFDNKLVNFEKNRIITYGINLHPSIQKLKSVNDSNVLLFSRFDYFNEMLDETNIIQHLFEDGGVDDDKDDKD
jgi:predicted MFS family arabinose efflux permease